MIKHLCFSVLTIVLSGFILSTVVFARDNHSIRPVLPDDAISISYDRANTTDLNQLMAENTPTGSEDDELAKDLSDDFEDLNDTMELQLVSDPLYYFNYAMYAFNDFLYFAAIKPIATGYKDIMPTVARIGVNNFFHNLLFPVRFVNNILQGEIMDAGKEIQIFLINSTIGVLGFSQMAQNQFNLQTSNEDFGQTLGSYSIGNGFYLVLPFLGPSTFRDAIGLAGDFFLTPVNYVDPFALSLGIWAYDLGVNAASFRLGDYEAIKAAALDPYVSLRDAYIQNRKKEIRE